MVPAELFDPFEQFKLASSSMEAGCPGQNSSTGIRFLGTAKVLLLAQCCTSTVTAGTLQSATSVVQLPLPAHQDHSRALLFQVRPLPPPPGSLPPFNPPVGAALGSGLLSLPCILLCNP